MALVLFASGGTDDIADGLLGGLLFGASFFMMYGAGLALVVALVLFRGRPRGRNFPLALLGAAVWGVVVWVGYTYG